MTDSFFRPNPTAEVHFRGSGLPGELDFLRNYEAMLVVKERPTVKITYYERGKLVERDGELLRFNPLGAGEYAVGVLLDPDVDDLQPGVGPGRSVEGGPPTAA